ncbi:LPS-assembly protein [Desulfuromusa kysingii]|uniref:LPS-assembly protein n=1 Tax=Desulfuromusa kysingii TaxID=37625 RepID=A0A1H3WYQ3_9BACT|nr:LPS assembly protein LptD [Desulfuromusa kysingii]SDZ92080.1 LPS-assembly protein [Desulfuromusa kysingii]
MAEKGLYKIMWLRSLLLIILISHASLVLAADWKQVGESDLPVQLEADQLSYNKDTGLYHASGDVKLIQGELDVRSQVLEWNQINGDLMAEGDVRLISPDEELSGSKVRYNLQQETGTIENGHFFLRDQNLHVYGQTIERRGELDYLVKKGTFTTCDGDVPAWKFGASHLDVTLGGYARARNTIFYLKNVPTLYFPYMIYPAKTDRESGLLIPGIGYSDKRGFQYSSAYYQVLGINQDATLYLDYLSEMGIGKGLEYRYIFGNNNAGEARVYHMNVDKVDGEEVDEERYAVEWQHDGTLPGGVRMVADVEYVNDDEYFEDFGTVAEEYNKESVESLFYLSKSWGKYSLLGQLKYTKDLEDDDDTTLQLLPRISFDVTRQRIANSAFYYALDTEYSNFWRQEGVTGERLMVKPLLAASFQPWDVIGVTPELSYRERLYWNISDDSDSDNEGIVEFSTRFSTRMQRIYDQPFGFSGKLKHSLEPEVVYSYIPEVDQDDLPYFDQYDDIDEENQVELALVQRFTTRTEGANGKTAYRQFLYLRLSQTYDLTSEASGQRFQDLRLQMTLLPSDWFSLSTDTTLDVDSGDWTDIAVTAKVQDKEENSLRIEYSYDSEDEIDYGLIDLSVAFLKPVYLIYQQRYDYATDEQLEQVVGIEYRQQCWSAQLSYRDNEGDRSVMLVFTMNGIGSVGNISGSLGGS